MIFYGSVAIGAAVLAGCPVFPADNPWNQRVDRLPVHPRSDAIVRSIGAGDNMHADFGSGRYEGGPIGIPYVTVRAGQRRVPVSFDYADESDRGRYPIPPRAPIEGGRGSDGDRHVLVVDRSRCRLYELFDAHPLDGGARWHAGSGAIFNLRSNRLRPRGYTSADAAGLPILPGLARYPEVRRGRINHALRFTASRTRRAFIYPARHFASDLTDPDLPAMGQRLRLRRGFDISGFPRQSRIVLRALKRYGMILADNGSSWYVSGAPSRGWNNDDLHSLHGVPGQRVRGRGHVPSAPSLSGVSVLSRHGPGVRIGCSGWQYDSWRGRLYPEGLGKGRWLARYAEVFDTVEVNSTLLRARLARRRRALGRADAARLRLRRQGEPLHDAHQAPSEPGGGDRALLRGHRAARGVRQARSGRVAVPRELQARRRSARRRAAAAATRAPLLRVPA